jgi:hypothetical protein
MQSETDEIRWIKDLNFTLPSAGIWQVHRLSLVKQRQEIRNNGQFMSNLTD